MGPKPTRWSVWMHCAGRHTRAVTVSKTIDGIVATAGMEANLSLVFSDRDFLPDVEHFCLEAD